MSTEEIKDYHVSHPWLSSSEEIVEQLGLGIDEMDKKPVKAMALYSISRSVGIELDEKLDESEFCINPREVGDTEKLVSYPLSRILISLLGGEKLVRKFSEYYAEKAVSSLREYKPKNCENPFEPREDLVFVDSPIHFGVIDENFNLELERIKGAEVLASSSPSDDWKTMKINERKQFLVDGYDISEDEIPDSSVKYDDLETVISKVPSRIFDDMFRDVDYYSVSVSSCLDNLPEDTIEELEVSTVLVSEDKAVLEYDELLELIRLLVKSEVGRDLPMDFSTEMREKFEKLLSILIKILPEELSNVRDVNSFDLLDQNKLQSQIPVEKENTSKYPTLESKKEEINIEKVREHYKNAKKVYVALGVIDGQFHTNWLGSKQHSGWYVNEKLDSRSQNPTAWDEGFPNASRPSILPDDFNADEAGRAVYTTNSYSPRESYTTRYYKIEDGEQIWMDEYLEDMEEKTRLPDYGELGAYSLIVDIDLEDDWKSRPLPDKYKEIVESRLNAWIGAFSEILGGNVTEDIFVVDSGGGAYVMTPPAVTLPIYEEFDEEERDIINNEINNRMRTLTGILDEIITSLDEAPDELFSGDVVQNKNRQWKTLLSIHSSLNTVVHPIDPKNPSYDSVSFEDITDKHYERAFNWSKQFTKVEYSKYIQEFVESIFHSDIFESEDNPHTIVEGDDWKEILKNFVKKQKEQQKRHKKARELIQNQDGSIENVGVTTQKEKVDAAIASVDLKKYLKQNHVQEWDTDNRSDDTTSFSPRTWRNPSKDANSCFYSPDGGRDGSPIFRDRKEGWTAGIIDLIAYDEKITDSPSETPTGKDWWEAVNALRERGEDIPILLPDITSEDNPSDKIGKDKLAEAALALETATEDQIEEKEGKYGKYKEITDPDAYNRTLGELEERNIKHGRQRRNTSQ